MFFFGFRFLIFFLVEQVVLVFLIGFLKGFSQRVGLGGKYIWSGFFLLFGIGGLMLGL